MKTPTNRLSRALALMAACAALLSSGQAQALDWSTSGPFVHRGNVNVDVHLLLDDAEVRTLASPAGQVAIIAAFVSWDPVFGALAAQYVINKANDIQARMGRWGGASVEFTLSKPLWNTVMPWTMPVWKVGGCESGCSRKY